MGYGGGHGQLVRMAERVFNTPLMIEPGKADAIRAVLGPRFGIEADMPGPQALYEGGEISRQDAAYRTIDSVAVLAVHGTLVQRGGWMDALSGIRSYQQLGRSIEAAIEDPDVRSILLDVDSAGGEVAGVFHLAESIRAASREKPVWAIANEKAFSAGYLIASAADRIILPQTAGVGSIGIITAHVDVSEADEKAGIKITPIYAGERKADFNPHAPLSREANEILQAEVDRVYGLFVSAVAGYRGLTEDAVRGTKAGLFFGPNAVTARLADSTGTLDDALAEMAALNAEPGGGSRMTTMEGQMAGKTTASANESGAPKPQDQTTIQAEAGQPEPESSTEHEDEQAEGDKPKPTRAKKAKERAENDEEVTDDRDASATIVDLCSAAGVPSMAASLIREGVSVETARARVDAAGQIRAIVESARKINASIDPGEADKMISAGVSVDHARAQMFEQLVKLEGPDTRSQTHPDTASYGEAAQAASGWEKAFQSVAGRKAG